MCTFTWCTLNMVQLLVWWWLWIETRRPFNDNTIVFWTELTLRIRKWKHIWRAPIKILYHVGTLRASSPGQIRPVCETTSRIAEFKNLWIFTSSPPYVFVASGLMKHSDSKYTSLVKFLYRSLALREIHGLILIILVGKRFCKQSHYKPGQA